MTQKLAGTGYPRGGGKAVLAVPGELPTGEARRKLLLRYGRLVASLGGTYAAGDMNIKPDDLDVVAETCPWVYGASASGGDSGPGTARGVFHGIRAAVEHVFGSNDLAGRSVLVQGVGAVGANLARELAEAGARVLVSDVDETRAAATGSRPSRRTPCSASRSTSSHRARWAPSSTARRFRSSTAAQSPGAANNQLAEPSDAELLSKRGILFAPDYVVNSGGVIYLIALVDEGRDAAGIEAGLAGIADTLRTLFAEADGDGVTPAEAANRMVQRRLAGS